jgi:ubiquinone/menaquinone biosynthesis C-methylase UbiE
MYTKSASFYDAIYGTKDYRRESEMLHALIAQHRRSTGDVLLDVACGTGRHLEFLREHYAVMGLDLEPGLLDLARQRCPGVEFYQADMLDFDLGELFDVITCLFSAIGYVKTVERLGQAVSTMARHLKPGGLLVIEPWFSPEAWHPGTVHATFVDQPDLKIARMTISEQEDGFSRNVFHYMVAVPQGVSYFTEVHELGLFTPDDYRTAFEASGLEVIYEAHGLTGRGLYMGRRSL